MKKITVATSVILVILLSMLVALGLKLNSLSNSLVVTENAIQELKHRTEADSAKDVDVDTITFEQEIAIVDSAIKAEEGIVYKSIYEVPNVEYNAGLRWFQTLVRYPNGIPKILAGVSTNNTSTEFSIHGFFFLFMDEYGRELATGEHSRKSGKWRWYCRTSNPGDVDPKYFVFKDPNLCRNLNK